MDEGDCRTEIKMIRVTVKGHIRINGQPVLSKYCLFFPTKNNDTNNHLKKKKKTDKNIFLLTKANV